MFHEKIVNTPKTDIWTNGDTVSLLHLGIASLPQPGYTTFLDDKSHIALSTGAIDHRLQEDVVTVCAHAGLVVTPETISICGTRHGLYEKVFFLRNRGVNGNEPYSFIITKPKTPKESNVFVESQKALLLAGANAARLSIDALVPPRAYLETTNTPTAYFDALDRSHEGMYVSLNSGVPLPAFLTNDLRVNEPLQRLSVLEKSFLCAYVIAKACMARSLLTLLTLHKPETSSYVVGFQPKEPLVNAGDHVGYFDGKGKLHLMTVTFRGGTKQCFSINDLVSSLLGADELFLNEELALKKVDFIPPFVQGAKKREQWVRDIVRWSAKMVFEQIQKGNDAQYFHLFKEFLEYSGIDLNQLKSGPSPFHQKSLERVSNNFGSSWMEHMKPFPLELLLYLRE